VPRDDDDFEGIDISGPWGGIRIGSGGVRMGRWETWETTDDDAEVRAVRRRVRQRLDFYRHFATYVIVVGGLALLDWAVTDGWFVQYVALIWGAFVALQFISTFVSPLLWGRDVEERMVARELHRRRGRIHVTRPPEPPESG
jgi:hypothetical protein